MGIVSNGSFSAMGIFGPAVYAFKDASSKYVYVGVSKNGIGRGLSAAHHRMDKIKEFAYDFEYWTFDTLKEAMFFEVKMIEKYSPRYNVAHSLNTASANKNYVSVPDKSLLTMNNIPDWMDK